MLLFIPNPWAYRIGGRGRTLVRARARARCRAVYQKASERRGEEPRTSRPATSTGISGTRRLPFSLPVPRDGFCTFHVTIDPRTDCLFFTLLFLSIEFVNLRRKTHIYRVCLHHIQFGIVFLKFFIYLFIFFEREVQRTPRYYGLGFKNIGFGIFVVFEPREAQYHISSPVLFLSSL